MQLPLLQKGLGFSDLRISREFVAIEWNTHGRGDRYWLLMAIKRKDPDLMWFQGSLPWAIESLRKPALLFFKAHLRGQILTQINWPLEHGRYLELITAEPTHRLELNLNSGQANVILIAGDKRVALNKPVAPTERRPQPAWDFLKWAKSLDFAEGQKIFCEKYQPKPIPEGTQASACELARQPHTERGAPTMEAQWIASEERKWQKVRGKLQDEITNKQQMDYRKWAEWRGQNLAEPLPSDLLSIVDAHAPAIQQMEQLYLLAKKNERKIRAAEVRLAEVDKKLLAISQGRWQRPPLAAQRKSPAVATGQVPTRERQFETPSGYRCRRGKSAIDNMKLLRLSQPQDIWVHLADRASSHMFISVPKNQQLPDAEFWSACHWFVEELMGAKFYADPKNKVELIVAECRHIRPVKARMGSVQIKSFKRLVLSAAQKKSRP